MFASKAESFLWRACLASLLCFWTTYLSQTSDKDKKSFITSPPDRQKSGVDRRQEVAADLQTVRPPLRVLPRTPPSSFGGKATVFRLRCFSPGIRRRSELADDRGIVEIRWKVGRRSLQKSPRSTFYLFNRHRSKARNRTRSSFHPLQKISALSDFLRILRTLIINKMQCPVFVEILLFDEIYHSYNSKFKILWL